VRRAPIAAEVTATGTLQPLTTVLVGTYVSGRIQEIDVDYNSPVRKGQRVAKIDPAPFEVKVMRAEAERATAQARVRRAQAELRLQEATLRRQERLRADRVTAEEELDTARSVHAQAVAQLALEEASVMQAEAALAEARVNFEYTDIISPVDGVVLSRNVDVGQTVAASFQTPTLFVVAEDLTKMQVNANVSESDIGPVRPGQQATFSVDAYPARMFRGTVVQVRNDPVIIQNVVTYDVLVDVDNSDFALKPGMTATVTVTIEEKEEALVVSRRALRFWPAETEHASSAPPVRDAEARGARIWLVVGTELRPVDVEIGLRGNENAEIVAGEVSEGAVVALAYADEGGRRRRPVRHPR
jgi:HlyD family secretion protein